MGFTPIFYHKVVIFVLGISPPVPCTGKDEDKIGRKKNNVSRPVEEIFFLFAFRRLEQTTFLFTMIIHLHIAVLPLTSVVCRVEDILNLQGSVKSTA